MKIDLKNFINPSFFHVCLFILAGLVLWSITYVGNFFLPETSSIDSKMLFSSDLLWKNIISLIFTILNSILIFRLINRFTICNARTFMPIFVFGLLISSWGFTHASYNIHIILFLFILALLLFLGTYNNRDAVEKVFLGSMLISASSLSLNEMILIIPSCWLGLVILRSFSLRTILASIVGIIVPWILYIAAYRLFVSDELALSHFFNSDFVFGFNLDDLSSTVQLVYIGTLSIILIINIVGFFSDIHTYANHSRKYISFILFILISFALMSFLQDKPSPTFLPFIALGYSIISVHAFTMKKDLFHTIVFIVFCIVNIAYITYNFLF